MKEDAKENKTRYDHIEHAKLLASAIDRMGNNHIKWLFALFTIVGFSLTMDKFMLEINGHFRVISVIIVFIISFILQISIIFVSWKYLDLETKFRNKQKKVFDGMVNVWDMNPNNEKGISRKDKGLTFWKTFSNFSWIIKTSIIIIILYAISQIILIVTLFL